jgi:hypothetical protein
MHSRAIPERTLATGTVDSEHWELTAHREHGSLCMTVDIASVRDGDNFACGFDGTGGSGYWWEVPTDSCPAVSSGPLPSNVERVDLGPDLHATVNSFPLTFGQGISKYWVYAATAESSKRMFASPPPPLRRARSKGEDRRCPLIKSQLTFSPRDSPPSPSVALFGLRPDRAVVSRG